MAKQTSYTELLKDPRWQKKRLKILERDKWTCKSCGNKEQTLHVHHLVYDKGKKPWEYSDLVLMTLCESCHTKEYEARYGLEQSLLYILRAYGYLVPDLELLTETFSTMLERGTLKALTTLKCYDFATDRDFKQAVKTMKNMIQESVSNKKAFDDWYKNLEKGGKGGK